VGREERGLELDGSLILFYLLYKAALCYALD
jgi:hypothetical protein